MESATTCTPAAPPGKPAADQAAGFEIPALISAAATAEAWAKVLAESCLSPPPKNTLVRWIAAVKLPPSADKDTEDASSSQTGCAETSIPGFSASVPRIKSEFFGLIQNSSTLILPLGATPCRTR